HYYPDPFAAAVGDFGCAQGNLSLLLAEEGYEIYAVDINPKFIEYARLKHERGVIHWIQGGIDDELAIPRESLDVVVLGEVVEHCAFPEKVVHNASRYLKRGGLMLITTPNGSRIKSTLPTFSTVLGEGHRRKYTERQFGPDQKDHLFQFTLKETRYLIPEQGALVEWGYAGTSRLVTNRVSRHFLRFLPVAAIKKGLRALAHVPWINARTCESIFVVLRKHN
ncbi:MAG: methyltransferase domain-containing protein, partial [Kiritimatiellae bacterium]|nr:methyltransferase domain-containing protein [Kiritimatiellia bacterium]